MLHSTIVETKQNKIKNILLERTQLSCLIFVLNTDESSDDEIEIESDPD